MARNEVTEGPLGILLNHPLDNARVAWLAYKPITSGGVSDEVEIRTGRVFMVKLDSFGPLAHIQPDNAFDAYSKVVIPVQDVEVQV